MMNIIYSAFVIIQYISLEVNIQISKEDQAISLNVSTSSVAKVYNIFEAILVFIQIYIIRL